jgi:hypothetical protein
VVFSAELVPPGGVLQGGTLVTVRGSGFDALPDAGTSFARCRWGSIYNESTDTVPTVVDAFK